MGFHEKMHAAIAAHYYVRLTQAYGERGIQAFIHATQCYAEQRGRRMARRAIRDGKPLTFETYLEYGEWVSTEEMVSMGQQNSSDILATAPDFLQRITACPWHTQFVEMGLTEAGAEYCRHLDNSICRGFNPYLDYRVSQTLYHSPCCIHTVQGANVTAIPNKKADGLRGFDYHCAHSYWAYYEAATAIFGTEGRRLSKQVLVDLAADYGDEIADRLMEFKRTDFNACD